MDKTALRQLWAAKDLTVAELRERNPSLAAAVSGLVRPGAADVGGARQLASDPVIAQQLARARAFAIADVAGLGDAAAEDVADKSLAALDEAALGQLVAAGTLTEGQGRAVGLAGVVLPLVDENVALATAIRGAKLGALGGQSATTAADLAAVGRDEWEALLGANTHALPAGVTPARMADVLTARFAALSPARAFASRFPRNDNEQVAAALAAMAPVYARNPRVVGAPFATLDVSAVPADQLASVQAQHATLAGLAASYPGLAIADVLDDAGVDAAARAATATRRIALVQQLLARLGEESVLEMDLSQHDTRLAPLLHDVLGANAADAAMVLETLRAYQRTWAVAPDIDQTHLLVARGFVSALSIAVRPLATFTAASGLGADAARTVWERARGTMADVTLTAGAVLDAAQAEHGGLVVGRPSPAVSSELTGFPGFEALFGNLAFCACTDCQSILGPAAYFVDLMQYIDNHLRTAFTGHPGHALDLKTRRADLWTLPLTCDNTNQRVPTLDLVAEILENFIAQQRGYTGPLTDRAAVGSLVYEQTLPAAVDAVDQPFDLPAARADAYLTALGSSRAAVAEAVGRGTTSGLSGRVRDLITTPVLDLGDLGHVYGLAFTGTAGAVGNVDAAVMAESLGMTRTELGALFAMSLVGTGVAIVPAKRDANSLQNDVEWITGLTAPVLDRALRVTRLMRALRWSPAELGLACATIGATDLTPTALADLGVLLGLQRRLGGSVAEVCALCEPTGVNLAKRLGMAADELARLRTVTGTPAGGGVRDVAAAVALHAWWSASEYSVDDVAVVLGQTPVGGTYPDPAQAAAQTVSRVAGTLVFADTVFAVALGVPEQGSRDLITQNASLFEAAAGGWRLAAGVDVDTVALAIPSTALVPVSGAAPRLATDEEVRAALRPHRVLDALLRVLAPVFAVSAEKLRAIAAVAGQLPMSAPAVAAARGDGPITPLVALVAALRPFAVAFAAAPWDAAAIDFARTHPDRFAGHPLPVLDAEQLEGLADYAAFAVRASAADVQAALAAFDGTDFPPTSDEALARVCEVPVAIVTALRGRVSLPSTAVAALAQLARAARLARTLGVSGDALAALADDAYAPLSAAADQLAAAPAAAGAEQPVREAKRDALASYLLHSLSPSRWSSLDEIYAYFLIDVAAGGCSTTSRVVAATMSAQLYVHRVLMNLEHDGKPSTDPEHVELRMPADAAAEWGWRKNYRVWQANRTVFLWPENFLEPDLRDDKTPLFKELEQELLQTEITDQNVLDAYTKYLAGFEEVAGLTLAGAYHQIGATSDVLHLFGVSAGDPPTYYYRTCENLRTSRRDPTTAAVWSPWQKLVVQITGRKVSPIVHRGRLHLFWTDVKTKPVSRVVDGSSEFAGYSHAMSLRFTTLRPDGAWTPPQAVQLGAAPPFGPSRGQIQDPLSTTDGPGIPMLDPQRRTMSEGVDDYTLAGTNWESSWLQSTPSSLRIQFRDFLAFADVDLFKRTAVPTPSSTGASPYPQLLCARTGSPTRSLYAGTPWWMFWPVTGFANALIDEERLDVVNLDSGGVKAFFLLERFTTKIATVPGDVELLAVPGSESDALLQAGNDLLYLDAHARNDGGYVVHRFGTTLVESIARRLFEDGLDSVLDTQTQLALAEAGIPITVAPGKATDRSNAGTLDFTGPYGTYYREIYFHIPYLIANALSSRGKFAAAQRWYNYIFDPASTEVVDTSGVAPAEVAHRLLDRVWRCRELRGQDLAHIRDVLSDPAALALYRRDPFNPWAIARRRPSAVQQAIVMKYVTNLLDWGDSLFAQFTMESVNEALMIYIAAQGILGPRPVALGDCGASIGTDATPSYESVAPLIAGAGALLVELETWILGARVARIPARGVSATTFGVQAEAVTRAMTAMARWVDDTALGHVGALDGLSVSLPPLAPSGDGVFRGLGWRDTRTASWGPPLGNATVRTPDPMGGRSFEHAWKPDFAAEVGAFGLSVLQLAPVFCVPGNAALFGLWDRVEDRLFKIRHCQGLDGQLHELALFAPPLDPADLVAMTAAGLGLEDVLAAGNGNLPPYRFAYLIDRAKAFASLLSGLGGALLGAYEKKDGEHLNRVRLTQQQNLAQLTTQSLRLDTQIASSALDDVDQQIAAAEYRRDYFANLVDAGRNAWEITETVARHTASLIRVVEGSLGFSAAALALLPQIGSPFAMKYGGVELSNSARSFRDSTATLAVIAEGVANSAGFEANMGRREDSWRYQKKLADFELQSLQRHRQVASLRLDVANRALANHEKSLDQLALLSELTDERFTNLGLYTWLSAQMQGRYRGAYQNALALAKLAERAFRFERGDDAAPGLAATYWDAERSGLLAGDALLVDLQMLERRFVETNFRNLEIDQTFAVSQLDAAALLELRETGTCTFTANEVFFDLFYPGHYKRRIKAVRITIPCITGPYVNIGATLELVQSWIRPTPVPGAALIDVPPTRSVSIATSTAQSDAGVFELSFRDERYMPFEGLGAVSRWRLSLPQAFRQFDYQTINDVILSISYTADYDATLRESVESDNAALEGSIVEFFTSHAATRVFSSRQDFASAFTRLVRSAVGTEVTLEITDRSLPLVFAGRQLTVRRALLLLRTSSGASTAGVQIRIDGQVASGFSPEPTLGNLPAIDISSSFTSLRGTHTIAIQDAGGLARPPEPASSSVSVDAAKLLDLLLYVEYSLA